MSGFFEELKRRKVYRVAIAYAVGSWALAQGLAQVLPVFDLSKIGDLKVISRTSVMPYRGHTSNIREIAKTLGVSSVLEGSVRREGNRVRVNVQLINANNDEHLWANNYDRDLTDVFAIQTDLAREIAGALQAKLSP